MSTLDRRTFVHHAATAIGATPIAAMLAGCAGIAARAVPVTNNSVRLALNQNPELTTPGGFLKIAPEGHDDPILVLVLQGGDFAALSPICTHRGCTVGIEGTLVVCPCHGSTYNREGRVLKGPAQRPLSRYAHRVTADGELVIDLGSAS